MHTRKTAMILAAVVMTWGVAAVRADSVTVSATYNGDWPTQTVHISSPYLAPPYNGSGGNFYAGASDFTLRTVTDPGSGPNVDGLTGAYVSSQLAGTFYGFCIDLHDLISPRAQSYTWNVEYLTNVGSLQNGLGISADQSLALRELWTVHAGEALSDTSGLKAAAFQIALWTLLYDTPYATSPIGTTSFSQNNNATSLASSWVSFAWTNRASATADIFALVSVNNDPQVQSFSIAIAGVNPNSSPVVVPLPAAAGVGFSMLAGFGGVFGLRKRFKRRVRIAG